MSAQAPNKGMKPTVKSVTPLFAMAKAAIKLVESDGWRLNRFRGSHRQFRHPTKPRYSDDLWQREFGNTSGNHEQRPQAGGLKGTNHQLPFRG